MYVYGWFNFQRVEFCVGPRQRASTGTMQNSDDVSEHSALTLSRPISIVLHVCIYCRERLSSKIVSTTDFPLR
jgi:hypothetical protein